MSRHTRERGCRGSAERPVGARPWSSDPRRSLALAASVATIAGVALGRSAPWIPAASAAAIAGAVAAVTFARGLRGATTALAVVAVAGLGAARGAGETRAVDEIVERWPPGHARVGTFCGVVERSAERCDDGDRRIVVSGRPGPRGSPGSPGSRGEGRVRVRLRVPLPSSAGDPAGARATIERIDRLRAGDLVCAWAKVRHPAPLRNVRTTAFGPGHARARGFDLVGSVKSARLVERVARGRPTTRRAVDTLRARVRTRVAAAIEDTTARGLAFALLLGERAALDEGTTRAFRDAGIAHVLAISGLHVAVIVGSTLWFARRLIGAARLGSVATLGAIGISAGAAVVGALPSVGRAALFAIVAVIGPAVGRRGRAIHTLVWTLATLVMFEPAWIADPSLHLSFVACGGILLGTTPLARAIPLPSTALRASVGVSLAAYLATAPITATHFGRVGPAAVATNLVAVPLASGTLLATAAAVLAGPRLGRWPAAVAVGAGHATLAVARTAAAGPGRSRAVPFPPPWLAGAASLATLGAWTARFRSARRVATGLAIVAGTACHVGSVPEAPGVHDVRVVALDVGQGQSIVVADGSRCTVIDAGGGFGRDGFVGERVVVPALIDLGCRSIAALLLTHDHADHVGGAEAIARGFDVDVCWVGPRMRSRRVLAIRERVRAAGGAVGLAHRGIRFAGPGVGFRVLHPPGGRTVHEKPLPDLPDSPDSPDSLNDRSVVLTVRAGSVTVLLPADLEAGGERSLLARSRPGELRAELLVVGHHGSAGSTTDAWLDAVRPNVAWISAGPGNRFGHPAPSVLKRLRRRGVVVRRTDREGVLALGAPGASLDRKRHERQQEQEPRTDRARDPRPPERDLGTKHGRVAPSHPQHDPEPEQIRRERERRHDVPDGDREQERDHGPARESVHPLPQRERDVPAVELPGREQVERRHENAEPCGHVRRPRPDRPVGKIEPRPQHDPQQRAPHRGSRRDRHARRARHAFRGHQPVDEDRHRHDEAGDGAGDGDVEKGPAIRDRAAHPDDRTERPDDRGGNEIRQRGRDTVPPTREVVSGLVGTEDREDRGRERQALLEVHEGAEQGTDARNPQRRAPQERPGRRQRERGGEEQREVDRRRRAGATGDAGFPGEGARTGRGGCSSA